MIGYVRLFTLADPWSPLLAGQAFVGSCPSILSPHRTRVAGKLRSRGVHGDGGLNGWPMVGECLVDGWWMWSMYFLIFILLNKNWFKTMRAAVVEAKVESQKGFSLGVWWCGGSPKLADFSRTWSHNPVRYPIASRWNLQGPPKCLEGLPHGFRRHENYAAVMKTISWVLAETRLLDPW